MTPLTGGSRSAVPRAASSSIGVQNLERRLDAAAESMPIAAGSTTTATSATTYATTTATAAIATAAAAARAQLERVVSASEAAAPPAAAAAAQKKHKRKIVGWGEATSARIMQLRLNATTTV